MKGLNGAGRRVLEMLRDFTVAQRTIAILVAAVLVVGGIAVAAVLSKPSYSPLFTGLSASDASGVVAQLQKDKVPYQLADGGATIEVPAASVDAERLAAASAGLPSSNNDSYSLLDNLGVTASQFQQNVAYQRAIEGQLEQTIESISGVSAAAVQLAIPAQTVFTSETKDPTASVFVTISSPLSSDQVQSIVHLTSAAVAGMKDSDVSVVDSKGDTLSSLGGSSTGTTSEVAAAYETATKASVQAMLDQVVGPGNSTVTVSADVDASTGTSRSTTYSTPAGSPALSESSDNTNYAGDGSGSGTSASGVLGTDTTTTSGTTTSATGSNSNGTYGTGSSVKNNALNSTTDVLTIPAGTLKRQTIAVALNSAKVKGISAATIQGLVAAAAGVNASRGDVVTVASANFSTAAAASAKTALAQSQSAQQQSSMMALITTAVQVFGGIAAVIVLFVILRKLFKKPEDAPVDAGHIDVLPMQPPVADGSLAAASAAPLAASWNAGSAPLGGAPMGGGMQTAVMTAPTQQMTARQDMPVAAPAGFSQLRADVDALAGDPAQAADYLRALMGDRETV